MTTRYRLISRPKPPSTEKLGSSVWRFIADEARQAFFTYFAPLHNFGKLLAKDWEPKRKAMDSTDPSLSKQHAVVDASKSAMQPVEARGLLYGAGVLVKDGKMYSTDSSGNVTIQRLTNVVRGKGRGSSGKRDVGYFPSGDISGEDNPGRKR